MLNVHPKWFESRLMYYVKHTAKVEYLIIQTDKIIVVLHNYHIPYSNTIHYTNSSNVTTIAAFSFKFQISVEIFLKNSFQVFHLQIKVRAKVENRKSCLFLPLKLLHTFLLSNNLLRYNYAIDSDHQFDFVILAVLLILEMNRKQILS